MNRKHSLLTAIALATQLGLPSANAATYDLVNFPFAYNGDATAITATLTTNHLGTLSDPAAIETFLNATQYSATLFGTNGALRVLDNSNSQWELYFSYGSTPAVTLDVSDTAISLSFSTMAEYTGAALLLRSSDNLSILQYRQENNVSDYNFVGFQFNAVNDAGSPLPYGSTFIMSAIPVDEPTVPAMMAMGLLLVGGLARTRRHSARRGESALQ